MFFLNPTSGLKLYQFYSVCASYLLYIYSDTDPLINCLPKFRNT